MLRAFLAVIVLLAAGCGGHAVRTEPVSEPARGTVVLLHGYGRRTGSMAAVARRLSDAGYAVCNLGYGSLLQPPPDIVERLRNSIAQCAGTDGPVDFVTHSFGGILARALASEWPVGRVRRVVMLAPPNHGSELSDLIGRSGLAPLFGPVVAELGTGAGSLPNRLGPPPFAAGVIAGTFSVHPVGTFLMEGPNDGTVTVRSARLEGMRDFATVHRAHSFLMGAPEVLAEIEAFLADGCFSGQSDAVQYDNFGGCSRFRAAAAQAPGM